MKVTRSSVFRRHPEPGRPRWRQRTLCPALFVAAVPLLAGLTGGRAQAAEPQAPTLSKMSPGLRQELTADPSVRMTASTLKTREVTSRTPVRMHKLLIQVSNDGGKLPLSTKYFDNVHTHAVSADAKQIAALLSNPAVTHISLDYKMTASSTSFAPPLDVNGPSMGADMPNAQIPGKATPTLTGKGVTVAVIDSGISPVDDIKARLIGFKDCVNGLTSAYDDDGHGTHVAGIVAGDGTDSSLLSTKQYKGIAPGANLVGVKVLDSQGNGSASSVIAGLNWCIANQGKYKIKVINLSVSGPVTESYRTDPVCQAAEKAVQAGMVVIASAGNNGGGYGLIGSPANDPTVITVGASNSMQTAGRSDDRITTYTSRGPTMYDGGMKPDLVAPGNKIVSLRVPGSTIDTQYAWAAVPSSEYLSIVSSLIPSGYTRLSGTSMAAPAVAGAVALMLQQNGNLTPNAVKLALMNSAQQLKGFDPVLKATVVYDPFTQGTGELNIPGAVQLASLMNSSKGLTASPTGYSTISGTLFPWFSVSAPLVLSFSDGGSYQSFWANRNIWNSGDIWGSYQKGWGTGNLTWGGTHLAWDGNQLTWGGDSPMSVNSNQLTWGGDSPQFLGWNGNQLTWGGDSPQVLAWGSSSQLNWFNESMTWSGSQLTWGGDSPIAWNGIMLSYGGDQLGWGGDQLNWSGDQFVLPGD